jgi:hypothetical protein
MLFFHGWKIVVAALVLTVAIHPPFIAFQPFHLAIILDIVRFLY